MNWVIRHLESELRREKMFGSKHGNLAGDPKYKASAEFSKQRIPQLEEAIKLLKEGKTPMAEVMKKVKPKTEITNQLSIWEGI